MEKRNFRAQERGGGVPEWGVKRQDIRVNKVVGEVSLRR